MERMDTNVSMSIKDNKTFQLEDLNNEKMKENIGGIIFVSLLMILGFGGNSIALFVYLRKYRPTTHKMFIVCLGIVDLLTCCLPMPFILVTLRYPIMFQNDGGCKLLQFLTYAMCLGSSMILLVIAGERYRKICVPHGKQLSVRMSKYICILALLLGISLAWPAAVMYGNRTYKTGFDHVVGTECTVNDDFANTKYPAYFNIFLIFVILATLIALSFVYALIGKQIFRMKKLMSPNIQTNSSETESVTETKNIELSCSQQSQNEETSKRGIFQNICDDTPNSSKKSLDKTGQGNQTISNVSIQYVFNKDNTCTKDSEKKDTKKQKRTVAITRVLFIITVVYFCSFLPHLALRTAAFLNTNLIPNLSFAEKFAYQTFRWTFFINNMANPIIYGLYDPKFRREVRTLWRSCLAACFKQIQRLCSDVA